MAQIELRRLDPGRDQLLVTEALGWIVDFPRWMQDADKAWGRATVDEYLDMMRNDAQVDFGVFEDGRMVAEICIALAGENLYNSHLMMKRGTNINTVMIAAASVIKGLFDKGMVQGWSWALKRNHGLQNILLAVGMRPDGLEQYHGQSHSQPLLWCRYVI